MAEKIKMGSTPADEFDLVVRNSLTLRDQPDVSLDTTGYDAMKNYIEGDLLLDNGVLYLAVMNSTGESLNDPTFWYQIPAGQSGNNFRKKSEKRRSPMGDDFFKIKFQISNFKYQRSKVKDQMLKIKC